MIERRSHAPGPRPGPPRTRPRDLSRPGHSPARSPHSPAGPDRRLDPLPRLRCAGTPESREPHVETPPNPSPDRAALGEQLKALDAEAGDQNLNRQQTGLEQTDPRTRRGRRRDRRNQAAQARLDAVTAMHFKYGGDAYVNGSSTTTPWDGLNVRTESPSGSGQPRPPGARPCRRPQPRRPGDDRPRDRRHATARAWQR